MASAMRNRVSTGFRLDQGTPQSRAQMRRIEAAEHTMPVSIVALAAQHESLGFFASSAKRLIPAAVLLEETHLRGNVLHFFVQQVRFTILRKEISPNSAAQEG